jgi:hypothetical protein
MVMTLLPISSSVLEPHRFGIHLMRRRVAVAHETEASTPRNKNAVSLNNRVGPLVLDTTLAHRCQLPSPVLNRR